MNSQTKEAAIYKLNTFWREVVLSDDAPVTQHFPTAEEIRLRAYEIHLSQGAPDGRDLDDLAPGRARSATGKGQRLKRVLLACTGRACPCLDGAER